MAKKKVSSRSNARKPLVGRKPKTKVKKSGTKKVTVPKNQMLWVLERHGITSSGLKNWIDCREQFARRFIDGWTSRKLSVPLTYGSLWHLAHEFSQTKDPWQGVSLYREGAQSHLTTDALRELDFLIAQIKTVYPLYKQHYKGHDQSIKFLAHESLFSVPVEVDGFKFNIRGKRDSDYKCKGVLGLWEIKTKSKIDTHFIADALRCDFQTLLYLWAMRAEYGKCPGHLTYDVVKRPQLRQKANESIPAYLRRVKVAVMEKPSDWFHRWPVTILNSDIDQFEKYILMPILREFVRWYKDIKKVPFLPERMESPSHYLNLEALTTSYGRSDLYSLMVRNETSNYYKRLSPHPELDISV